MKVADFRRRLRNPPCFVPLLRQGVIKMDISLIVSILFKIYDEAKERLLIKSKKYEEGRNNFKKLIKDIISLIDDYVLSVDIILKFLNELYPDVSLPHGLDYSHPRGAYNYSSAEFLSLNRK